MSASRRHVIAWLAALLAACAALPDHGEPSIGIGGAADGWAEERQVEVVLTAPHCDVCTAADKDALRARSPMVARVVELIDGAETSVDAAQFTFSVREIEEALLRAHGRGVAVRLAMDSGQDQPGTVARRLRDQGLPVRFVRGRPAAREGSPSGLLHAKFLIADGSALLTGSNNWSSTGTTINEENAIVVRSGADDPLIAGFACHFEAIWRGDVDGAGRCSSDGVAFTPGSGAVRLLRDGIRQAETSVDVLMHHLLLGDLIKELARAAERGVRVRVVINAADRGEARGRDWDRLRAAGAEIRFKRTNADLYQLMHHKLAIVDGRVLLNGSGNWSGSAFFNNFENFVRYEDPAIVEPFADLFDRLWLWSLTAESLDAGLSAADQHAAETRLFFGNLHAHVDARDGDRILDDGQAAVLDEAGQPVAVEAGERVGEVARYAFEYARDRGRMDFLAVSPHVVGEGWDRPRDVASFTPEAYAELLEAAADVTEESEGGFLALASMEWSTNGSGNHVNILGSTELATVTAGRFDLLYEQFLPGRAFAGDDVLLMWNHPRTFRRAEDQLVGNWDQVYGVNLRDLPRAGERRQKFNDYGLDDFAPLSGVRDGWIAGEAMPDPAVVDETLATIRQATAPYLRMLEVTLGRGTELGGEIPVNPDLVEELDDEGRAEVVRVTRVHTDWDYYLLRGFRLAPAASHDSHFANWGTGMTSRTAIAAPALDERSLLAAIDRREVYASEDEDLALRFDAAGRIPMGGETATTEPTVRARLTAEDPGFPGPFVARLHRGRVGDEAVEVVAELTLAGGAPTALELPVPATGVYFFYVEVHEPAPNRMAWTAPIWVERL